MPTPIGGLMTSLVAVLGFMYFFIKMRELYQDQYTLQASYLRRDLTSDTTSFNLTEENFDMAVRLEYILASEEPGVQETLDQYVDLRVTQNTN